MELNTDTGELNWGFVYETEVPNRRYSYYGQTKVLTSSRPILKDGVLYLKGMRSSRIHALQLSGPSLQWQRPVAQSASLIGVSGGRLLIGGDEIMSLDLSSQKLQWSTSVPLGTSWVRPLLTKERIYQFTPRGIFELDLSSGDVVKVNRGADLDSLGGAIMLTPNTLITVSNISVTAYDIESTKVRVE